MTDRSGEGPLNRRSMLLGASSLAVGGATYAQAQTAPRPAPPAAVPPPRPAPAPAAAPAGAARQPNILVIFGDDIGLSNINFNSRGLMGYPTPNIDRIHSEGMTFSDYYGEQSCTAGRAAFITGQCPVRTGMTKVGLPGADLGLQKEDPTIAELLRPLGYATGQFGKNHLGDRDEFLPTNHGFDEFFGNLYHLNAEEEPENPDYPRDPEFRRRFGPRGVIHSFSDGRIQDTGPLNIKRMETIDDETVAAATDFIDRQHAATKPFFVWYNATRMHMRTHVPPNYAGRSGLNFYADGMMQHDDTVGVLLKKLDDLGIADNTILIYSTDNGPHYNGWPDGAITPFRSEKNTNWEGAYRVPCAIRWPGHIQPGSRTNEIVSANDWMPTLMAAVGVPDIKEKLLAGHQAGSMTYKVHLDGYNILPLLTGQTQESPRKSFFYWNDDGEMVAIRYGRWKQVFLEQRAHRLEVWAEPFVRRRLPLLFDLRMDPYERANTDANVYFDWLISHAFLAVPTQALAGEFLATFREFPPRQRPASFNLDEVMRRMQQAPNQ
ncbi:arylsulfatase [Roseococcus pinisoli]|uniref:Arylsulfatase n=1 Tax=Roseococcus pinisoli TaxID=2835040 RepID=A0ABS5QDV0_9PROT|nr:arylsulfatase [Roseococcus pinisoli]MBS7811864.1 arylsulfatase [Roseococcus pinisoli]